jgi:protein pelota
MDEVFLRIGQNGAVAYGAMEVCSAIDYGAVETIVVADVEIRKDRTARMIEATERRDTGVVVLSTEFEPGKRLLGLGGIAALLRYKISR